MHGTAIILVHTLDGNARKIVVLLFNPIYYGFEPRLIAFVAVAVVVVAVARSFSLGHSLLLL